MTVVEFSGCRFAEWCTVLAQGVSVWVLVTHLLLALHLTKEE